MGSFTFRDSNDSAYHSTTLELKDLILQRSDAHDALTIGNLFDPHVLGPDAKILSNQEAFTIQGQLGKLHIYLSDEAARQSPHHAHVPEDHLKAGLFVYKADYHHEHFHDSFKVQWQDSKGLGHEGILALNDPSSIAPNRVHIGNTEVLEGDVAIVGIDLDHPAQESIVLSISTIDQSATSSQDNKADFVAFQSQTIVIPKGETHADIYIQTNKDSVQEPNESFAVKVSVLSGHAEVGIQALGEVVIKDQPLLSDDTQAPQGPHMGQFSEPTSVPRDLDIPLFKGRVHEEYQQDILPRHALIISAEPPPPPPPPVETCEPPEGAISAQEFCTQAQNFIGGTGTVDFTINVTTMEELRDTIHCINMLSNSETGASFNFEVFLSSPYYLLDPYYNEPDANPDLDIYLQQGDHLTIEGCGCDDHRGENGTGKTTIDAKELSRIFDIHSGNVTIQYLELTGGNANTPDEEGHVGLGGAIYNNGDLTLNGVCVVNNEATDGGGIYSTPAMLFLDLAENYYMMSTLPNYLTLNNSLVEDNKAFNNGGGIYSLNSYTQILNNTFVVHNTAIGEPTDKTADIPIRIDSEGNITYFQSSYHTNEGGSGAGIYSIFDNQLLQEYELDPLVLLINNSHVDWNDSFFNGGGLYFQLLNPTGSEGMPPFNYVIENGSTVNHNTAHILGDINFDNQIEFGYGGGIYQLDGNGLIDSSQVNGNYIVSFGLEDAAKTNAINFLRANWDDFYTNVLALDRIPEYGSSGNSVDALEGNGLGYWDPTDIGIIRQYLVDHGQPDPGLGWQLFSIVDQSSREGAGIALDSSGYLIPLGHLSIINSSISQNANAESGGAGLAVLHGIVDSIIDSTFSQNAAFGFGWGGAISLDTIRLVVLAADYSSVVPSYIGLIEDSNFLNNYAGTGGGAILNNASFYINEYAPNPWGFGPLPTTIQEIQHTNFLNNFAETSGGALQIQGDLNLIQNSNFIENRANWDAGGAIAVAFAGHIYLIDQSTFSYNYAGGPLSSGNTSSGGGAIFLESAPTSTINVIQNSTFAYNTAVGNGGAIDNNAGYLGILNHVTIAHNEAGGSGGGLWQYFGLFPMYVANSIVYGNNDGGGANDITAPGSQIQSFGFNIVGPTSGYVSAPSDLLGLTVGQVNLNPTLALNGSSLGTNTLALLMGSSAIDAANPNSISPFYLLVDQREFTRPFGDAPDIGAYEANASPAVTPIVLDLNGDGVHLISPLESQITLQDPNGEIYQLGWVSGKDGILVYDANHDGTVSGIHEIELSRYDANATTDLQGLKLAFDSNHDNLFNSQDTEFNHFGIWQDANQNGKVDANEFKSLADAGILQLDLSAVNTLRVEQGNLVLAQGTYTKTDGQTGQFGDVALTKAEVLDDHHLATLLENSGGSPTFVDNQTTTTMIDTTSTQVSDPVVQQAIDDVTNATQNIVA